MNNSQKIAETIEMLAESKEISVTKILLDLEMNQNMLFTMKNKGCLPRTENLTKFAEYFDVSIDYLLGRTDVPEINTGHQHIKTGNIGNGNENVDNSIKIGISEPNKIVQKIMMEIQDLDFSDMVKAMNFIAELKSKS